MRFSFVAAFGKATEGWLSKNIPGYSVYKSLAEDKLHQSVKGIPFTAALVRRQGFWQPAYVVEQDTHGTCVVFLPDIPDTTKGHILLVKHDQLRFLSSLTANQLDESLRKLGKGLLSEHALLVEEPSPRDEQVSVSAESGLSSSSYVSGADSQANNKAGAFLP